MFEIVNNHRMPAAEVRELRCQDMVFATKIEEAGVLKYSLASVPLVGSANNTCSYETFPA